MSDPRDVLSIEEARAGLLLERGDVETADEIVLAGLITAASARLDELCGPIVARPVTDRLAGGDDTVWVSRPPILTITTITERQADGTSTVVAPIDWDAPAEAEFEVDSTLPALGRIWRRTYGAPTFWRCGPAGVTVSYSAGRCADTAHVDERFRRAAQMMVAHLWRAERGVGSAVWGAESPHGIGPTGVPTFAVPRAAVELLGAELLPAIA